MLMRIPCLPSRAGAVVTLSLAFTCAGLAHPSRASAGPWTREPGRWYVKLGQSVFVADGFRDASGEFSDETRYLGLDSSIYAELGVLERLHAQLYLPFKIGNSRFDDDSELRLAVPCEGGRIVRQTMRRTPGDALFGLQWTSPWLRTPHAARLEAKLPLYDVGEPRGACADLFPQPGDGQVDVTLWLSVGDSLRDLPLYLFGELGHRFRTEAYPATDSGQRYGDTFVAFGQLGWELSEGTFLMLNVQLAQPYTDDHVTKGSLALGPALYLPVGRGFALEAGLELTPLAHNSSQGSASRLFWTGANVGVSHKYD
jgi:hypothetical protein